MKWAGELVAPAKLCCNAEGRRKGTVYLYCPHRAFGLYIRYVVDQMHVHVHA